MKVQQMSGLKRIAVLLLPPLFTDLLRKIVHQRSARPSGSLVQEIKGVMRAAPPEWEAVPETSWIATDGWLHPSIVDTQVAKWEGFAESIERPNALGVAHEAQPGAPVNVSSHNIIMTFGYVLGRATATGRSALVRVLDWGGGIGHYALLARQLYPETAIRYTVCELQPLAEAGRKLVSDVEFTADGDGALEKSYNLIYASSSLQYVRDLYGLLAKIAKSGSHWIMICRMPFVDVAEDFVVVQRPQRYGYDTEYTGWFLNRNKFVSFMQTHGYRLDREFLNDERPAVANAPEQCSYRGFLFERSAEKPSPESQIEKPSGSSN
jgi:putative methyltransferase (TIGR04325 family)